MSAFPRFRGVVPLFKQACNEIPEVVGACAIGVLGMGLAAVGLYKYYTNDGDNKRYKMTYVVMRSSDPRAKFVHKD